MCWRSGHLRAFIPCPPASAISRWEKVDWNAEGRRWPDKDSRKSSKGAVGVWGPRTGNVNQEMGQWVQKGERSWLTRWMGEADLLIRLEKEIVNGEQREQDVSVKNWLDLREEGGREGGREWLEDRQAEGQGSEQRSRWCLAGPENWGVDTALPNGVGWRESGVLLVRVEDSTMSERTPESHWFLPFIRHLKIYSSQPSLMYVIKPHFA